MDLNSYDNIIHVYIYIWLILIKQLGDLIKYNNLT